MRNTAHLPATKISIQILATRFYGNLDVNIRYHINAGYLKAYLQDRHQWSEATWGTIDINSFGTHFKTIPLKHRPAHLKYVHNQLPLGHRKYQRSAIKDPAVKLCPCCKIQDEDDSHFIHCSCNTARTEAIQKLLKTLLSDPHPSSLTFAACIEQHLQHPHRPVTQDLPNFPPHLISTLNKAIDEQQTCIGWSAAMKGFLSRQWFHLTSANLLNHDKFELKAGRHRTQKALHALQDFTRDIWLGRNDALHKDKETVDTVVYSAESAEIRHFHSNPKLLPASDAHYCKNITLDRIIRSRPSVRRRWLRRVRTARATFLKDGNLQQSITPYLQSLEKAHNTDTTARLMLLPKIRNIRSTSTQQRMTSFFPGRPPDLHNPNTPGNPSLPNGGR